MKSEVQFIISQVCDKHNVEIKDVMGRSRPGYLVKARHECMFRLKNELNISSLEVAKIFNRTHATVLNAWKNVKKDIDYKEIQEQTIGDGRLMSLLNEEKNRLLIQLNAVNVLLKNYTQNL